MRPDDKTNIHQNDIQNIWIAYEIIAQNTEQNVILKLWFLYA